MRVALLLLAVVGCLQFQPSNGAYFTVRNQTTDTIHLLLEDAPRDVERNGDMLRVVRVYDRGCIVPGKTQFFQWVWAANTGRFVIIANGDTTRSPMIRPWEKLEWWIDVTPQGFTMTTKDR